MSVLISYYSTHTHTHTHTYTHAITPHTHTHTHNTHRTHTPHTHTHIYTRVYIYIYFFSTGYVHLFPLTRTQSSAPCIPGARSQGSNRLQHKANCSFLSTAEIKNPWSYFSPPLIRPCVVHTVYICYTAMNMYFLQYYRFIIRISSLDSSVDIVTMLPAQ